MVNHSHEAKSKPVTAEPTQTYVVRIPEMLMRGSGNITDAWLSKWMQSCCWRLAKTRSFPRLPIENNSMQWSPKYIITVDHNDVEVTSEINMILSQNANTSKNPPGFIIMFQL